ncbi:MAG: phosphoribosyltransferase family protein [Nevskiales bacterium]|nr:phosphoribosyltransferase family protein [Nevskiales bacterium]
MRFHNRRHAGQALAVALGPYLAEPAVVYALPRGGVPLGVEVALAHRLPLELMIVRKIGHPWQPEYALCAVSEGGQLVCNEAERRQAGESWLQERIAAERAEALRRRQHYCDGRPRRSAEGRCAIVVDDGIATGLSMEAAVLELKQERPQRIIVAVAVAPSETAARFSDLVDAFVTAYLPEVFEGAVGNYYDDFTQLSDAAVIDELRRMSLTSGPGANGMS